MGEPKMPSMTFQEKPPQEVINFRVGDKEYDLEISTSEFEYPQSIQEESGIIGYTRQKIDSEKLFELVYQALSEKNINLSEMNMSSMEDWVRVRDEGRKSGGEWPDNFFEAGKVADDFCIAILSKLSNGEYPMNTINHQLSGFAGDKREEHAREFIKDRFFLQKIYDLDLLENTSDGFFNHHHSGVSLSAFNKKTNQYVGRSFFGGAVEKFGSQIEKDQIFFTTGGSGLNFSGGSFFSRAKDHISFGFSDTEPLFDQYLTEAMKIYTDGLKNESGEKLSFTNHDIVGNLIETKLLGQDFLKKFIALPLFLESPSGSDRTYENTMEYTSFVSDVKDYLDKMDSQFNIDTGTLYRYPEEGVASYAEYLARNTLWFLNHASERNYSWLSGTVLELRIPIFINNDNIPQLQWGHAKYAHFINEKGFNFIQFKHTDRLPKKVSVEEDSNV